MQFREITLEDRETIHRFMYGACGHGCEYSFANLLFWGDQKVAFLDGLPLIFSRFGSGYFYQIPLTADLKPAVDALRADARERGIPFRLFGLTPREVDRLAALYPGALSFFPVRDNFDYVYHIERLTELKGKKLQSKRNHCNRFVDAWPDYRVLPLTPERIDDCRAFTARWYEEHAAFHDPSDYDGERVAIEKAFRHFDALHMEGIILETAEGMVGFSMGNRIREDTFDVNYEKALAQVNGAYPMVNREFARRIHARYPEVRYLNREDDMGIEGLRRAKESYFPDILLEKWIGEEKTT